MRTKIIVTSLLIAISFLVYSFSPFQSNSGLEDSKPATYSGIQFMEEDWNKALAEARRQKKMIFLDAYASWCGPCKLLKRKTFPDKEAGNFFNSNYINVAIDMEKGDGPVLSQKFAVSAYPTLIITDADGNLLTYTQGYITPKQLIDFGKHGLSQKKN